MQNLENILRNPFCVFHSDFVSLGTMRLLKLFGLHRRVSPLFVSMFCFTRDFKKSQRESRFAIFGAVILVKKISFFKIFRKLFKISRGSTFTFFISCNQLESHKTQRSPFTFSRLRYSAGFGPSRLVYL